MKNKFINFFNKKGKNIFEIIYFFITFILLISIGIEISKRISLIQIFITFIIFSIFYFFIKNNSSLNNENKINKQLIKKYSSTIFYSSFLILSFVFLLGLFYPNLENIFKYFFYGFLLIYIFLKIFGFEIDYKFGKINFFSTNFLKISIILLSVLSIIIYKNIHFEPIKETKKITKKTTEKKDKKKNTKNKKTTEKKKIEKTYEEIPEFETFEEKLKRLKKQKTKIIIEDKFKNLKNSENILEETFEQNLYPRTKGQEEEIKKLQKKLKKIGFFSGNINGIFDKNLQNSLKNFLIKKCEWPETTKGYFGPQARECLNNL